MGFQAKPPNWQTPLAVPSNCASTWQVTRAIESLQTNAANAVAQLHLVVVVAVAPLPCHLHCSPPRRHLELGLHTWQKKRRVTPTQAWQVLDCLGLLRDMHHALPEAAKMLGGKDKPIEALKNDSGTFSQTVWFSPSDTAGYSSWNAQRRAGNQWLPTDRATKDHSPGQGCPPFEQSMPWVLMRCAYAL